MTATRKAVLDSPIKRCFHQNHLFLYSGQGALGMRMFTAKFLQQIRDFLEVVGFSILICSLFVFSVVVFNHFPCPLSLNHCMSFSCSWAQQRMWRWLHQSSGVQDERQFPLILCLYWNMLGDKLTKKKVPCPRKHEDTRRVALLTCNWYFDSTSDLGSS